jgi:N-acetyl-gamma-glutamyl-phosphate reductase
MSRGILASCYVKLQPGHTLAECKDALTRIYQDEPFVHVLEGNALPQTRHVRGSNHCFMNIVADRIPGRVIIISVIDNVVKGASGQALQNMNLMLGLPETMGLNQAPMFP